MISGNVFQTPSSLKAASVIEFGSLVVSNLRNLFVDEKLSEWATFIITLLEGRQIWQPACLTWFSRVNYRTVTKIITSQHPETNFCPRPTIAALAQPHRVELDRYLREINARKRCQKRVASPSPYRNSHFLDNGFSSQPATTAATAFAEALKRRKHSAPVFSNS